jgi:nicotinate-nucleotide pyrophosphorylase
MTKCIYCNKSFCGNCEEFTTYTTHKEVREYKVIDEMIKAEMTIVICDNCHQEMYIKEIAMKNDKAFFDKYNKIKEGSE